jgi:hypothetical protein
LSRFNKKITLTELRCKIPAPIHEAKICDTLYNKTCYQCRSLIHKQMYINFFWKWNLQITCNNDMLKHDFCLPRYFVCMFCMFWDNIKQLTDFELLNFLCANTQEWTCYKIVLYCCTFSIKDMKIIVYLKHLLNRQQVY